jgi:hypothetical protein
MMTKTEEKTMFTNLLYGRLPTSLLLSVSAFLQYFAIRAFA